MFFRLLSQLYQGLGPIDPPPYYEQEAIKFRDPLETPSHVFHLYDPPAPPWKHPEREAMEFTAFRLTAAQLVEIHNTVTKGMEHLRISRVDVVVAALALCLSEIEPEAKPIDTISYVISVSVCIHLSFTSSYLGTAQGYGHISGQCGCQRNPLVLYGDSRLGHRSLQQCFCLCHQNTEVTGEVKEPRVRCRYGWRRSQDAITSLVGQEGPGYCCRQRRALDRQ